MAHLILLTFAAFLALSGVNAKEAHWIELEKSRLPDIVNLGDIPHMFINGPLRRGTFSFKNASLNGGHNLMTSGMFDPVNFQLYLNYTIPQFSFEADYCVNLQHFKESGDPVTIVGEGHMQLNYNDFNMLHAKYNVRYSRMHKRYQLDYPDYDLKVGSVTGHMTGLKNAANDAPVTLEDVLSISTDNKIPLIVEIYRALNNIFIRRGFAKSLANGLYNSFLLGKSSSL